MSTDSVRDVVREKYGAVAEGGLSSEQSGVRAVARAFGYTESELAAIPAESNMGLSCGNPTAIAELAPGEVVVDLGSGGGLDVFLAARRVGPTGRAIGIDMTPEMISLARRNAAKARDDLGAVLGNVEFYEATIDAIPLEDGSVDCVISNCVINLASDKAAVFREIWRILKPGGRLVASDIALKKPLPAEVGGDLMAYVGCIAGAILVGEYRAGLMAAGFDQVEIVDAGADLNAYSQIESASGAGCCGAAPSGSAGLAVVSASPSGLSCCAGPAAGELHESMKELLMRYDVNEYAASVKVRAVKPR